jgi:hypothetical protein
MYADERLCGRIRLQAVEQAAVAAARAATEAAAAARTSLADTQARATALRTQLAVWEQQKKAAVAGMLVCVRERERESKDKT